VTTGLGFAAIGDGQRALGAFERATALDPGNTPAWLGRGVASVMTGDEAGAEKALEQALKLDPKSKPALDGLKWLRRPAASKTGGK
jgi:Flp pilus assembly protein TadD